jgi:hypothetical protein
MDDCCDAETAPTSVPLACTLPLTEWPGRLEDWREVLAEALEREATASGARLVFDRQVDIARLAALAAAEQGCCAFLEFDLAVRSDAVVLEIRGAVEARPVIDALVAR